MWGKEVFTSLNCLSQEFVYSDDKSNHFTVLHFLVTAVYT